jgi:D-aspartate ligase
VDFGFTSTFVETIEAPRVAAEGERLLASVGYRGLAEVEFKLDPREDRLKVLDVNTRAWTWIGLGAAAGVDLPYLAWRYALGLPISPAEGRPGLAWIHAYRDLVAGVQMIAGGRLRASDYLASLSLIGAHAGLAGDDMVPFLLDLPLVLPRIARRILRR